MSKTAIFVGVLAGATLILTNVMILNKLSKVEDDLAHVKKEVNEVKKEAELVKTSTVLKLTSAEQNCLAKNIFHEAGVEPKAGKIAVAQVTLNRLKAGQWRKDVFKVVYSKAQFSWTLEKKKRQAHPKGAQWQASVQAAKEFQKGVQIGRAHV